MSSKVRRLTVPPPRGARYCMLAVLAALMVAAFPMVQPGAEAAPPLGAGDCWRPGTPHLCRTSYNANGYNPLNIYVIDNFSDQRSMWVPALVFAAEEWTAMAGPQVVRGYGDRAPNDSWVYFEDSETGYDGLWADGVLGLAWNCEATDECTFYAEARNIHYSSIKLNKRGLDVESLGLNKTVQTHELGHALGLGHSGYYDQAMYVARRENKAPTFGDIGANPPCGYDGSPEFNGLRCIYKWSHPHKAP